MPIKNALSKYCAKNALKAVVLNDALDGHAGVMRKYVFVHDTKVVSSVERFDAYMVDVGLRIRKSHYGISAITKSHDVFNVTYYEPVK